MSDTKTILFIDGHDKDRQLYAQSLKVLSPEYVILEAGTGPTGLELYNAHPIDCVVLELELSDMSGFEVLTKLIPSAQHPHVAVVVLTRLNHSSLLEIAKLNGARDALLKTKTSGELLFKAIAQALSVVPDGGAAKRTISTGPINQPD
jgi:CheY-like chemotaxis protein